MSVTPFCDGAADKVCYKLGAVVTYHGQAYGQILEDSIDAALLPYMIPVPLFTGEWAEGPDEDGDGYPSHVSFTREHVFIEADATLRREPAPDHVQPIDPDDKDPSNPLPKVTEGPHADVTPACDGNMDKVCYKIGAVVTYQGQPYGTVFEDEVDAALLPYTLPGPVLTGQWSLGEDADATVSWPTSASSASTSRSKPTAR